MLIVASLVAGAGRLARLPLEPRVEPFARLVSAERSPKRVFLVPPRTYRFRLEAAVPTYVDYKSNPYADRDVLEWRRRLDQATRAFAHGRIVCARVEALARREGVTDVVAKTPQRASCPGLVESARTGGYVLYRVRGRAAGARS